MTIRAIILGLLAACLVCIGTIVNNHIIHQTHLVGNQIPIIVYGNLVLFIALINPLLWRLGPKAALSGKELAVVVAMALAACCVPQSGLMRTFTPALILPFQHERTDPGWKSQGVVDLAPKRMLADVTPENRNEVLIGFMKGLPRPDDQKHISFADVPWSAWTGTMSFWLPLILSLWIGLIGLSLVLHRQWSTHEQLAYPIATFANSLLPDEGRSVGGVFRQRLFWVGAIAVLVVHTNNYVHKWFPDDTVMIQRSFDLSAIADLFPTFKKGWEDLLVRPHIYFTVIAFAYFLATDVSLSIGIGPFIYCYLTGLFITHGVVLQGGGYMHQQHQTYLTFGAYAAMFGGLAVMGRHYYGRVFGCALGLPVRDRPERVGVWGARVFMLGLAGFVFMLWSIGLDWQLAVTYSVLIVILYVVVARLVAETGFFHPQVWWFPCVVMMGFFGPKALSPPTYMIMILVSVILVIDPREIMMPYIVNLLKLLDLRRVKLGPMAGWSAAVLVLAVLLCVALSLYIEYDKGMNVDDSWSIEGVSRIAFRETMHFQQRLTAQDALDEANTITGWSRFAHMMPHGPFMISLGVGIVLVGVCMVMRMRFARWPIHPVMFLIWCTYPGAILAASFLIGWFIKVAVTRYGGAAGYQRFKPLMIGLIAGDMVGSIVPFIIGAILRLATNLPIKNFSTMPG